MIFNCIGTLPEDIAFLFTPDGRLRLKKLRNVDKDVIYVVKKNKDPNPSTPLEVEELPKDFYEKQQPV